MACRLLGAKPSYTAMMAYFWWDPVKYELKYNNFIQENASENVCKKGVQFFLDLNVLKWQSTHQSLITKHCDRGPHRALACVRACVCVFVKGLVTTVPSPPEHCPTGHYPPAQSQFGQPYPAGQFPPRTLRIQTYWVSAANKGIRLTHLSLGKMAGIS